MWLMHPRKRIFNFTWTSLNLQSHMGLVLVVLASAASEIYRDHGGTARCVVTLELVLCFRLVHTGEQSEWPDHCQSVLLGK